MTQHQPFASPFPQEPSVSIPGLSRYAELQELAKRKKEEEQRRQEEVGELMLALSLN